MSSWCPTTTAAAVFSRPDDYSDFTEVVSFIAELDFTGATNDILAGIDYARALPEVDADRVAVWGYCTGGTLAMLASMLDRRLGAAVWFFPSQPTFDDLSPNHPFHPVDLIWAISCPVLVIYGDEDPVRAGHDDRGFAQPVRTVGHRSSDQHLPRRRACLLHARSAPAAHAVGRSVMVRHVGVPVSPARIGRNLVGPRPLLRYPTRSR